MVQEIVAKEKNAELKNANLVNIFRN